MGPLQMSRTTSTIRRVSNTVKRIVAHKYKYKCADCAVMLPPMWECDHIVPLWKALRRREKFGTPIQDPNHRSNLQPLCPNRHSAKTQLETIEREQRKILYIQCPFCPTRYSPYFTHEC